MPGPGTSFLGGPVMTGTVMGSPPSSPGDMGLCRLAQRLTLTQAGLATVSATILLPQGAVITGITADTTVAWNSGTSDTLSVGTVAGGSQYIGGISTATAGRAAMTYTGAQLAAMNNIGTNTAVVATVTPAGTAANAGTTIVTVDYIQTVQLGLGIL